MKKFRSSLLFIVAAPLLSLGCAKTEPPAIPAPPPGAKADADAVKKKMEELKAKNPNMPDEALGTMAVKMVQEDKARGGAAR